MASNKYWEMCLGELLSEFEIKLTPEKEQEFIEAVIGVADMEWEATGREFIPHPLEAEKRELERALEQSRKETRRAKDDFVKNVCMRHNVEPSQVYLEGDGEVTIRK